MQSVLSLQAGDELAIGSPSCGLRTYLAVRGGIDVLPVLGARATDTLSGLGPPRLQTGMVLPIGTSSLDVPTIDVSTEPFVLAGNPELRIIPGPRDDWFEAGALATLCSGAYEVSPMSDRIGLRLTGPVLTRANTGELPPEGMVAGALQVPPSGQPILFLADHPVTGGYPVIAVVHSVDIPIAAQLRPGQTVSFACLNS